VSRDERGSHPPGTRRGGPAQEPPRPHGAASPPSAPNPTDTVSPIGGAATEVGAATFRAHGRTGHTQWERRRRWRHEVPERRKASVGCGRGSAAVVAPLWPRGVRPFGLTEHELAAEIARCRAWGWQRWELLAVFGRLAA
jgi:hypothetical protein